MRIRSLAVYYNPSRRKFCYTPEGKNVSSGTPSDWQSFFIPAQVSSWLPIKMTRVAPPRSISFLPETTPFKDKCPLHFYLEAFSQRDFHLRHGIYLHSHNFPNLCIHWLSYWREARHFFFQRTFLLPLRFKIITEVFLSANIRIFS